MTLVSQSWRVILTLCVLVVSAYSCVSFAQAEETDVETLQMQVMTLQTGLQLLQSNTLSQGSATCTNGNVTHPSGATVTGLTLNNGLRSSIRGFQYRCANGRWIFEKVTATGTSSSSTASTTQKTCVNESRTYPAGAAIKTVTIAGKRTTAKEGMYVCRGGNWQHDKTSKPGTSTTTASSSAPVGTCTGLNKKMIFREGHHTFAHFAGLSRMPLNRDKDNMDMRRVVCKGGKWVFVKDQMKECKLGVGQSAKSGATSSNPFKGIGRPDDRWNNFGPYNCVDGTWVPRIVSKPETSMCAGHATSSFSGLTSKLSSSTRALLCKRESSR